MILSCIVDAEKKIDVSVIDDPNAFIQTRIKNKNEMTVIKIRGVLADLILEIYPNLYGPFVTTEKKYKKLIIVQFINSIYGTMVDSLLY